MHTREWNPYKYNGCMVHTRTRVARRRALASGEGLVYRQARAIRYPPGSQLPRVSSQRHNVYNTVFSGFEEFLGGFNHAALVRFMLATVTPDVTSILSTSSTSLFLCRFLFAFSSFFTHAALNLQLILYTVLYKTQGLVRRSSSPPECQNPDDPLSRSTSIIYPSPTAHVFPRSPAFPTWSSWVTCGSSCGRCYSMPAYTRLDYTCEAEHRVLELTSIYVFIVRGRV